VIDFAVKLAEKRQGTSYNKSSVAKSRNQLVEVSGGKEKKKFISKLKPVIFL